MLMAVIYVVIVVCISGVFEQIEYPKIPEVIKTSRDKDALIYQGYYHNEFR